MAGSRGIVAVMALGMALQGSPAWALMFLQGDAGMKTATVADGDSSGLSGYELEGNLHFDPIPLLPVAFGWSMGWSRLTGEDEVREVVGYELAMEIVGWYTFAVQGKNLSPYVKVGQAVFGAYRVKGEDGSAKYAPSGLRLSAGLRWDVLFRLGLLFELEKASGSLSGAERSFDADSLSLLFGWQTGI
jgi:hypothetical protein